MRNNLDRTKKLSLKENRYEEPKETQKKMIELVMKSGILKDGCTVCDFGCAAGELLYNLSRKFPNAKYFGYEIISEVVEKARKNVPGVEFETADMVEKSLLPEDSLDIAIMTGVHQYYDNFEPCFSNLLYWTRPGGIIYVFGAFNPYPMDVLVKSRFTNDPKTHHEPGWNMFSVDSVSKYLDSKLGEGKHSFIPYELPLDIAIKPEDPRRTWTFKDSNNKRHLTNGMSLIINAYFLEIHP